MKVLDLAIFRLSTAGFGQRSLGWSPCLAPGVAGGVGIVAANPKVSGVEISRYLKIQNDMNVMNVHGHLAHNAHI